jgi:hypothetical protein
VLSAANRLIPRQYQQSCHLNAMPVRNRHMEQRQARR